MPKSHKSPRLSVKCGTTLTKPLRTDWKSNTKRTRNKLPRISKSILPNTERLRKRKREKIKSNDL